MWHTSGGDEMDSLKKYRFAVLIPLLFLLVVGCSSKPSSQTSLMKEFGDMDVSKRELETFMYHYGYNYAVRVDVLASEIYRTTVDPDIRMRAVEWNTLCVSEMFKNSFNHEPMVGLIKTWLFASQVREFFDTGYGKDYFGAYQDQVVTLSREFESDIARTAQTILPPDSAVTFTARVETMVDEHPITNDRYVTQGLSIALIRAMGADVGGGLDAVGEINEQFLAMTDRTNLYAAYAPRQIQWQTAAMFAAGQGLISDISDSTIAVVRREASAEFGTFYEFIAEQRALITRDIANERTAILESLAGERTAILLYMAKERIAVFEEIAQERIDALEELNALSLSAMDKAMIQSQMTVESGIDRAFLRTVQVMLIPFGLLVIFILIVMIWVRKTLERFMKIYSGQGELK